MWRHRVMPGLFRASESLLAFRSEAALMSNSWKWTENASRITLTHRELNIHIKDVSGPCQGVPKINFNLSGCVWIFYLTFLPNVFNREIELTASRKKRNRAKGNLDTLFVLQQKKIYVTFIFGAKKACIVNFFLFFEKQKNLQFKQKNIKTILSKY